jgi:hypothetical protein
MLAEAPVDPAIPASDLQRATRFYRGAWLKDSEGNILGVTEMRP